MKNAVFIGMMLVLIDFFAMAQPGSSGMAFLKLGVSGRGVAMSDAMTASVSGAAANHYNPAGLLPGPDAELMFMHREWVLDTRSEFLGTSFLIGSSDALGFALNTTTVSDIEVRTRPGDAEATFSSRDLSLSASYAHAFSPELRLGITAKFLYQKIFVDDASGFGVDVGCQWDTPIEGLHAGLALANLGTMSPLRSAKTTLPALGRAGAAFSTPLESINAGLTVGVDGLYVFPESRAYVNTGAEILFAQLFAVRAGYQAGSESRGLTLGGGVFYKAVGMDYSFSKLDAALGNAHTISLSVRL
jgi:hypothetical protein